MARTPSAMDVPFHTDIGFLAQRRRGLLRDPHKAQAQARRLSIRRRPASRDQPLPRRAQSAIKALHLDRRSRQNHRRRQARAPSVRFDPLASLDPRRLARAARLCDGIGRLRHSSQATSDVEADPARSGFTVFKVEPRSAERRLVVFTAEQPYFVNLSEVLNPGRAPH